MGMNLPWKKRDSALSFQQWVDWYTSFNYNGVQYTLPGESQEEPGDYTSVARAAYKANGVIFACMLVRQLLFSEARFQYRRRSSGRPGDLFGTDALGLLEVPWPGGTTGDLLAKNIQYADLAGNAFTAKVNGRLTMLRPDWVTIVTGSREEDGDAWSADAEVVGYIYKPGGPSDQRPARNFLPEEVAHFAPIPDPEARFRGMSWLTPVIREIMADKAATDHKLKFFENSATPNMVVKFENLADVAKMRPWIELFREQNEGRTNAYKTLFMGAGMDATPVGASFKEMDFKITQGAGETRIAAAAGVPPVIVGLSEGLQAATYSNYSQARRRFADGTMRPLWRNMAASLQRLLPVPTGAELWYDDRDIPFLAEDQKDAAEVLQLKSTAMKTLVDAGFDPETVVSAVEAGDLNLLKHSGLVSVQLQEPGAQPGTNGAVKAPLALN